VLHTEEGRSRALGRKEQGGADQSAFENEFLRSITGRERGGLAREGRAWLNEGHPASPAGNRTVGLWEKRDHCRCETSLKRAQSWREFFRKKSFRGGKEAPLHPAFRRKNSRRKAAHGKENRLRGGGASTGRKNQIPGKNSGIKEEGESRSPEGGGFNPA